MEIVWPLTGLVLATGWLSGQLALGAELPRPVMPGPGSLPLDPDPSRPDLVIKAFTRTGSPTVRPDNTVEVPVRVVIQNVGTAPAGPFGTGITLPSQFISTLLAFSVQGQPAKKCPTTTSPLPVGGEVQLAGKVVLPSHTRGSRVTLYAVADQCQVLVSAGYRGAVSESNEKNNRSDPLSLTVP